MQKNTSGAMSTERAHFNETMKPTRVRVEDYIGLLKNRFQFLAQEHMQIACGFSFKHL